MNMVTKQGLDEVPVPGQIGALVGVALMGIILHTVPDWTVRGKGGLYVTC